MTHWCIVRTDLAYEQRVAAAIERTGYQVWCPMETRSKRITAKSRSRARECYDVPLLPGIFLAAAEPMLEEFLSDVKGFDTVDRQPGSYALCLIPEAQVELFRRYVDEANAQTAQRAAAGLRPKGKKKWLPIGDMSVAEVLERMFGVKRIEEAA